MATWVIEEVNLAGVAARNAGGGGYVEPVTGAYKVRIAGTEQYQKEDRVSIRFQTMIEEGEYAGTEMRLFIGTDLSKVGNQRSWKTALLSAGVNSNVIESGNLRNLSSDQFDGKIAYVYFRAKDSNDPSSQSDKQFITPESYASLTGNQMTNRGSTAATTISANPAMNVAAAPQPGGSSKLRGMLQR